MQWLKVTVAFAPHAYITAEQRSTMRPQHTPTCTHCVSDFHWQREIYHLDASVVIFHFPYCFETAN